MQIVNVGFLLLPIVFAENTGLFNVCFPTQYHGQYCAERGVLELSSSRLSSSIDVSKRLKDSLKSQQLGSYISGELSFGDEKFVSSYPLDEIRESFVEQITVRLDVKERVIGLNYNFKPALGSPLFSVALVDIVRPVIGKGPLIVPADIPRVKPPIDDPLEEQSFLKKYWWIIIGVMLFSSVFGNNQPSAEGSGPQMNIKFNVKYRSNQYVLEIDEEADLKEIFAYLGELIDFNHSNCKLIVSGKSYFDESISIGSIIKDGQTVIVLSSSIDAIEGIKKFKSDPLVKGFERENLDEQNRVMKTQELNQANPWGEYIEQDKQYRFNRIEMLFKRTNPAPFEAEKLLQKLTLDPGIISILKQRQWIVETLCEIDPEDADIEQVAKGEGDKCLLGWNRNFGQRIALRLRTDDLKGFRNYQSIVNTLIHELTHNQFAPHDEKFWALFNQLKQQYAKIHSERNNAHTLGSAPMASNIKGKTESRQHVLGGTVWTNGVDSLRLARLKALDKQ